jgi:amino acid adenylation domain-containing protein
MTGPQPPTLSSSSTGSPDETIAAMLPLSAVQEDMWYTARLAPDARAYHEMVVLHRRGPLDVDALRTAFDGVVARHEAWRTTFPMDDAVAGQQVMAAMPLDVPVIDLRGADAAHVDEQAVRAAAEIARRPYDLDRGPLVRPVVVHISDDEHRIYIALHHLLFDGLGLVRVAIPELIQLYDAAVTGEEAQLSPVAAQYSDYTRWERTWIDEPARAKRREHWRRRLDGAGPLLLPIDRPRRSRTRLRGGAEAIRLAPDTVAALRDVARSQATSLFQIMLTGFAAVLSRYAGSEDLMLGTITDFRRRTNLENVLGYCASVLPLRVEVGSDTSFVDLLGTVRDEVLASFDAAMPFGRIVRALQPNRDPGLPPLVQVILVEEPTAELPDGWELELANARIADLISAATLDLQVEFEPRSDGSVTGRAIYDSDLFDAGTIRRFVGHWETLLAAVAAEPTAVVSRVPLLSPQERHRQLVTWNQTDLELPRPATVHDVISAQVARTPDAPAVSCGDNTLTYAELDRAAMHTCRQLINAGVGTGDVVAVCLPRSAHALVGMLGVLKAGAAYLPIDPRDPEDRREMLLNEAGANVALAMPGAEHGLTPRRVVPVSLDAADDSTARIGGAAVDPDSAAYVIFTSGSTGTPKGVRVAHRAVVNLMAAMAIEPGIDGADVVVSVAAPTFDASVGDIFGTLGNGGHVVLATDDDVRDPQLLAALVDRVEATQLQATPTTWRLLFDTGWSGRRELVARTGGEALPDGLAAELTARFDEVWNLYGPTEATVWATAARLTSGAAVTVGRALANMAIYLVDQCGEPVPVGAPGEICIGGTGVALGYLNRPDETSERFVADPWRRGHRMYRTGDIGRWRADGTVEWLGRLDDQVKVRGVRIEPAEIEAALTRHSDVSACAVVARDIGRGSTELAAYVVPAKEALDTGELRRWLRTHLPASMLPSSITPIAALPLSPNGKIDRRALLSVPQPAEPAPLTVPSSDLESAVATIWARALGVPTIGAHVDVFDLGGHSLLAVSMLADLERELGHSVPVAAFLDAGTTVAGLARWISSGGLTVDTARPEAAPRRQLVVVWPSEPSLLSVRHLRNQLGDTTDVISLVPDYAGADGLRLEDLVTALERDIRAEQPTGPYAIAGFSLGGVLAYEVAGRLSAQDEQISWLGLLDTATPKRARQTLRFVSRVARALDRDNADWRRYRDQLRLRLTARLPGRPADPLETAAAHVRTSNDVTVEVRNAHTIPMHLFVTDATVWYHRDLTLGWSDVHAGPLSVHRVKGTHASMLAAPQVEGLVDILAESFLAATAAGT